MGKAQTRCYVASPLGFTEAGRSFSESTLLPALTHVVKPVDPWALTSPAEWSAAAADGREREIAMLAGRRNSLAIRSCSLLVAVLEGQELDSGTAAEVGYAAALGVRCFGFRTDLRSMGEPGTRVSLQVEAFIEESGGEVVDSVDALVQCLRSSERRPE
jgi:nucleoside 2-deoxyribosyltransferase